MLFRSRKWLELLIVSIPTLIGLALRQTNLMTVPALTDEFKEVGWAITMIDKNRWPLVAVDAYDGPLFPYLLSFLFRIFGYNIYLPRVFVLVVGVLTIVVVYFFARELAHGDLRVAFLAASLLAFNAHHILFNSHVAWSNDLTPFFTTLALWFYIRARRVNNSRWLIAAGFVYGLAVQTHPSALALAPAFVIHFLWTKTTRAQLKSVVPYLALLAALFAYSPVLYYNLTQHAQSLQQASGATYAFESAPSLATTLDHIEPLLSAVANVGLGTFDEINAQTWNDPRVALFWIGTVSALAYLVKRGETFPLIALVTSLIFLALFDRFYAIPDSARYFQFLNPIIFSAWAMTGVGVADSLLARAPIQTGEVAQHAWIKSLRWGIVGLLLLAFAALLWTSLTELNQYYADVYAKGQTNEAMLAMVQAIRADPTGPVLIDWNLVQLRTKRGGNVGQDLIYLLSLERREYMLVTVMKNRPVQGLRDYLTKRKSAYLVSFTLAPDALGSDFPLAKLIESHFMCTACPVPEDFALFHWERP